MAERVAFLIGNQTFRPDSGLLPLQGPANDVAALACLLRDPERGKFEVHESLDKPCHEILPDIAHALNSAAPGGLFLIYYSGHGKLDRSGRLCLATADTRQSALRATSIPARHLRDLVEESDCDQVVLLLDCCYSGAVEDGLRGDVGSELQVVEDARGFYIMTASTGMQSAREIEPVPGDAVMGRFTAAMVHGIETGAADLGRKGKILLSDLRRHLGQVVTGQTPQFFDRRASGDPLISLSPATAPPLLDPGVLADLDAEQWHRRRGAVSALAGVLRDGDEVAGAAAKAVLQRRLGQERDYYVRAELESALGQAEETRKADERVRLETEKRAREAQEQADRERRNRAQQEAEERQVAEEKAKLRTEEARLPEERQADDIGTSSHHQDFKARQDLCRNIIAEARLWDEDEAYVNPVNGSGVSHAKLSSSARRITFVCILIVLTPAVILAVLGLVARQGGFVRLVHDRPAFTVGPGSHGKGT